MQKLLTIVVPVYKVEPYINKCLDSCVLADEKLMSQLEVIIVNDGTPDCSAEMSREYVKRYPQTFRQIDKENGGHGSAWNVGLKEAAGKYLRFLDSDDWLTNLDKLMEKLAETDADLVFTHLHRILVYKKSIEPWILSPCNFNITQPITEFKLHQSYNCSTAFWLCTYKTSIIQPFHPLFAERISYDDTMLYIAPLINAKTFICYDIVLYNYLIGREGQSISPDFVAKKVTNHISAATHFMKFYQSHKAIDEFAKELIDLQTAKYCVWVWGELTAQSYNAMKGLHTLYEVCPHHMSIFENSKQVRLYKKLPLPIYWAYYKLAKMVNKSAFYRKFIKHRQC